MSDWDFLDDMHNEGYSPEEIEDAASCGFAPWEYEYISREWIDSQLEEDPGITLQSRDGLPFSTLEQFQILEDLVDCAIRHFENTGRYLQIWGELGEIYAETKFGLRRHDTHRAGSDGIIAGKLVEVKTISPEKASNFLRVKSQGDFEKLLIVRIYPDFRFQSKFLDRSELKGQVGKFLRGQFKDEAKTVQKYSTYLDSE